MESTSQIISHPKDITQFLPPKLKNKFKTQQADIKNKNINFINIRKKFNSRYKRMSVFVQKFITYEIGNINSLNRQKLNKTILNHIKVYCPQLALVNLVNESFLSKMSEGIKSLSYDSSKYQLLLQKIQELFKQILPIPKKRIMIGIGQISQLFYVFFQNSYEQPYSLCCNSIVYLKIQLKQPSITKRILRKHKSQVQIDQVLTIKSSLFCSRCNTKIIQFYGQQNQLPQSSFSPKKIHEILQIQRQRIKVKMSIMIGSGRFKRHRINEESSLDLQNSKLIGENGFQQNRYQSLKLKHKDNPKYKLKSVQTKSNRNQFFHQLSQ